MWSDKMSDKDKLQHIIELDGAVYLYSKKILEQVADLKLTDGDKVLITDLQEASVMTMTLEVGYRYAELMVRRKLHESGDFDEPVEIITHWKKKRGKNSTDIFFTALPSRIYHSYFDQFKENNDCVLLFPLYQFLFKCLKKTRINEVKAIVFQHNRYADLIIGNSDNVYYANRSVAFDTSKEQIASLWTTVSENIKTAESDHRIDIKNVFYLNWIESNLPDILPEELRKKLVSFDAEEISFNGTAYNTSFLKSVKDQSVGGSVSPFLEKIFYYTKKTIFSINLILIIVILLSVPGYFYYDNKADMLEKKIADCNIERKNIKQIPALDISKKEYKDNIDFIKDLAWCRQVPSLKKITNDISDAVFSEMKVEALKIDYKQDKIHIELFGTINALFDAAYNGYQNFIDMLNHKGYVLTENRFDTKISTSEFFVKFSKQANGS